MGVLANFHHERFCQVAHARIWSGEKRPDAIGAAYLAAIYTGDQADPAAIDAVKDNARRLANSTAVKERLAELATYSGQLAALDAGWCSLRAKRMAEFDTNKLLAGDADLSDLPGDVEIIEVDGDEGEEGGDDAPKLVPSRKLYKMKIKASDRIAALTLIARLNGYLAPESAPPSVALTVNNNVATIYAATDDQLLAIAIRGSQGTAAPPPREG